MIRVIAITGVVLWLGQAPTRPGAALTPGLELVYVNGADTQPMWTIDAVSWDRSHEGRSGCSHIVLRMGAPAADVRWLCRSGDTLLFWTARNNRWTAQRPLATGVSVILSRPGGGRNTFEAGAAACDVVGDARIATIATTVLTTDSTGRAVRRLRERYAPGLATATGGTFEVPDGDGWKVEREFKLVALLYPLGVAPPRECSS